MPRSTGVADREVVDADPRAVEHPVPSDAPAAQSRPIGRLYDGKDHFTICDFVKAHHHSSDPAWDGEPMEPEPPKAVTTGTGATVVMADERSAGIASELCPARIKVTLADGKARNIQRMTTTNFWSADGRPMSAAQFLEVLYGALLEFSRTRTRSGAS